MLNIDKSVDSMWESYLFFIGENRNNINKKYSTWYFSNNEEDANNLLDLVIRGEKTGTSSLYYWYTLDNEQLPRPGEYSIITNWEGIAQCIIKTRKVTILPFKYVTEEFAIMEGEGDKSLEYWRNVHIKFFTEELKEVGKQFNEDMNIVYEEFEVVFK
ncbi:ASCH domain-containing protein [Anaerosalibacter massiliensis]|uniref:ASCH domain-containing protein n=1 Tax=Anaerosalibacter massiliensis TaxID=1347392 RepID=A0A9X2S8G1_9FIRM|nr:ASCH domain-containing protein [Anaerosalibacter massiliensis]MCR2045091.1 ASCH domain-containing protein [Anaerosalibacter massiliensis]